jgi:hypothetical protein
MLITHQLFPPPAFAAMLSNTETFHYSDAMHQLDHIEFMKAMVKEVDDLSSARIWELKKRSKATCAPIKVIWSFKRKRTPMEITSNTRPSFVHMAG